MNQNTKLTDRSQKSTNSKMNPIDFESYECLEPTVYNSSAIGISSFLVRHNDNEHFLKLVRQAFKMGFQTQNFIDLLTNMEKSLSKECEIDIERSAVIARLRFYLENNGESFQINVLNPIKDEIFSCMTESVIPQMTWNEFINQKHKRREAAFNRHQVYRITRFQNCQGLINFPPLNVFNLKQLILRHFDVLRSCFITSPFIRSTLIQYIRDLLQESFFIIQQPTSSITTHSSTRNGPVTAKINCRIMNILGETEDIIVQKTVPIVCCMTTSNEEDASNQYHQQPELKWETLDMMTSLNTKQNVLHAKFTKIQFNSNSSTLSKKKIHYSPFVYYIDFHINVRVNFGADVEPLNEFIIVRSAPFGVVTNAKQAPNLFTSVFVEDLKNWKYAKSETLNSNPPNVPIGNLTCDDIVESIMRYFTQKTGIYPKPWIQPYIQKEIGAIYTDSRNLNDERFRNILARILAQIDFMGEHPLLALLHDDGLFVGLCDSNIVNQILKSIYSQNQSSISVMRFGSIHNMIDAKNVHIRLNLVEKNFQNVQLYSFNESKISYELGLFIIKVVLCSASHLETILCHFIVNEADQVEFRLQNMHQSFAPYDSETLRKLCPHKERYISIWFTFDEKENQTSNEHHSSETLHINTNNSLLSSIETNSNSNRLTTQTFPTEQTFTLGGGQLLWNADSNSQLPYNHIFQTSQPMTSLTNEQNTFVNPVFIVLTHPNGTNMTREQIAQTISNRLPQYSQTIQPENIQHINFNSMNNEQFQQNSNQTNIQLSNSFDLINFDEIN